jgi:acetate kinase
VFTGGIGENSPEIRRRISAGLGWTGLEIDEPRNAAGEERISSQSSRPAVYNIRTDEELLIARQTSRLLGPARVFS